MLKVWMMNACKAKFKFTRTTWSSALCFLNCVSIVTGRNCKLATIAIPFCSLTSNSQPSRSVLTAGRLSDVYKIFVFLGFGMIHGHFDIKFHVTRYQAEISVSFPFCCHLVFSIFCLFIRGNRLVR